MPFQEPRVFGELPEPGLHALEALGDGLGIEGILGGGHHRGHLRPGQAAIDPQDQQGLLGGGQLLAQARNRIPGLGPEVQRRRRSDLGGEAGHLIAFQGPSAAAEGITLAPEPGVPGEGVDPGADRGVTAKPRQAAPQVLAELGEGIVGAIRVTSQGREIPEDARPVSSDDHRSSRPAVAGVEKTRDLRLERIHERGLPRRRSIV